jgi:hypothetical protein
LSSAARAALARNIVIKRPIQGVGEFVQNRFRCSHEAGLHGCESLTTHSGRLDDLCPTGDVLLHKIGERLLTAARLVWNFVDEVEQPLARNIVIKRPIQGVGEFVQGFGVPFGANNATQADTLNSGKPASFTVGRFVKEVGRFVISASRLNGAGDKSRPIAPRTRWAGALTRSAPCLICVLG